MKKHLFLKSLLIAIGLLVTSLTTQVWADDYSTRVIGCAANSNSNYNAMKVYVDKGDGWGTEENAMSKAGITFEGKDLYVGSYNTHADGHIYVLTFKKYKNSSWVSDHCAHSGGKVYYWDKIWNVDGSSWYAGKTVSVGARVYFQPDELERDHQ